MRVNYRGVQVLCTKCFGKHHKSKCETRKAQFKDYVINFAERNPGFPEEAYGRWIELIRAARGGQRQVPVTGSGSGELDVAPSLWVLQGQMQETIPLKKLKTPCDTFRLHMLIEVN